MVDMRLHSEYPDVLKAGAELRSFVWEEVWTSRALMRGWKPLAGKLRKQLDQAVASHADKALNLGLWIPPDMYAEDLETRWSATENIVRHHLTAAYRRAFAERGEELAIAKADTEDFEPDEDYWRDLTRQGSTLDKATGKYAGELEVTVPLLNLVKTGFLTYFAVSVIPKVHEYLALLRDTTALPTKLKATQAALDGMLEGNAKALLLANLSVARAYNFGFLDYAERESVQYYKISSMLDSRVCASCRAMNGKIFSVADARAYKQKFLSVVGDVEQMKQVTPFLTKDAAEEIAQAEGEYSDAGSKYFPPLHGNCRCRCFSVPGDDLPARKSEFKRPVCRKVLVDLPYVRRR